MIATVGLQAAMIIGEPDWDFTLRNPSHYGKNGMVAPGGWLRQLESVWKVTRKGPAAIKRASRGNSSFGLTRTQEPKEKAGSEIELCEPWSRTGIHRFH